MINRKVRLALSNRFIPFSSGLLELYCQEFDKAKKYVCFRFPDPKHFIVQNEQSKSNMVENSAKMVLKAKILIN